jgi:DNA-binding MarR family transcriptional regulator
MRLQAMSRANLPQCTVFRLRMAARRATRLYDRALAPAGLGASQYGILMMVAGQDGASVSAIAALLEMDRTTLTRNVRPLMRSGYLRLAAGGDQRTKAIFLTEAGRETLARARPLWKAAQALVSKSLGATETAHLHDLLEAAIAKFPAD